MDGESDKRPPHRLTLFELLWLVAIVAAAVLVFRAAHAWTGNAFIALLAAALAAPLAHGLLILCLLLLVVSLNCCGYVSKRVRLPSRPSDVTRIPRRDLPFPEDRADPRFPPRPDR
jgi:hypothetical protein